MVRFKKKKKIYLNSITIGMTSGYLLYFVIFKMDSPDTCMAVSIEAEFIILCVHTITDPVALLQRTIGSIVYLGSDSLRPGVVG